MKQAARLGLSKLIPSNWDVSDGSLKEANSADIEGFTAKMAEAKEITRKKPRHRSTRAATAGGLERRAQLRGTTEQRRFATPIESVAAFRTATDRTDGIQVTGCPIRYQAPYQVSDSMGSFTEVMLPGCVRQVLASGPNTAFLSNHEGLAMARCPGTMTLTDSASGLIFTASLDRRQTVASDLAIAIQRGDVSQMSVGFIVCTDRWSADYTQRTITSLASLLDVSAVTNPASPTTSIELTMPVGGPDGSWDEDWPYGPGGLQDGTGSRALLLEADTLRTKMTAARARALRDPPVGNSLDVEQEMLRESPRQAFSSRLEATERTSHVDSRIGPLHPTSTHCRAVEGRRNVQCGGCLAPH